MCQVPPIGSQEAPSSSQGGNASISTSPIPFGPAVRMSFSKKRSIYPILPYFQRKNDKILVYAQRSTFLAHTNFKIHDNVYWLLYQSPVVAIKQYINLIYLYPGAESFSASCVLSHCEGWEGTLLPVPIWARVCSTEIFFGLTRLTHVTFDNSYNSTLTQHFSATVESDLTQSFIMF